MRKTNFLQSPGILLLITLILSSILLTSCWVTGSLEMDLIVYRNDKYEMDLLLQIPSESILFIGGVEEFESALKDMLGGYSDNEENWVWEKYQSTNNSTYFYKIKSDRSDIVNGEFFDWKEIKYNNRKAYLIEFIYAYELSELMSDYKLTLHADKILESNGTQIDNKTVTWMNPNSIPYAVVIPKGSIQWFPLLLLFYFILIFIATCLYLILSGKLKKWSGAATSTKTSRIEASKYEIEKRNIEHEKKNLLTNLGKKAWDSRIQHDNYASNFTELEFLNRQQIELPKKINSLEEQLNQFRFDRTSFLDTFKTKQIDLESKSKQLNDFVIQSEVRLHEINKRLSVIDQEHTEIRENEFNSSLLESEKLKNEKLDLEKQISSAQKEINTINDQINQIYDEKKSTISAIDEKIKKFVEESRKTRGKLSGIRHKTPYLISSLGSLVNMTRPNNEILYPFYQELDTIETKLSSISSEYDLIKTQLDISDKNYKRNFYLSIFGLILILSVIILLIVYLL